MTWTNDPPQMFDHELNPVKGAALSPYALEKVIQFADSVDPDKALAGRVCHIDPSSKKAVLGSGQTAANESSAPMPLIVFQGGKDFDVLGDKGNFTGAQSGETYSPHPMGLVCSGGFEVETTEFDSAQTYLPNETLVGDSDGIVVHKTGTRPVVCGIVSDGQDTNDHKKQVLRFWTVFLPFFS